MLVLKCTSIIPRKQARPTDKTTDMSFDLDITGFVYILLTVV